MPLAPVLKARPISPARAVRHERAIRPIRHCGRHPFCRRCRRLVRCPGLWSWTVLRPRPTFFAAVWVRWQINRRFTFRERAQRSAWTEWCRYFLSMLTGASVNDAAYIVVLNGPRNAWTPLVGVACGSVAGMFANFSRQSFGPSGSSPYLPYPE